MKNNDKQVFEACKYKSQVPIPTIKRGDVLFCQSPTTIWLCRVSHIEGERVYYHANYNMSAKLLNLDDWFLADYIKRMATDEEVHMLDKILKDKELLWVYSLDRLVNLFDVFIVPEKIHMFSPLEIPIEHRDSDKFMMLATSDKSKVLLVTGHTQGLFSVSELELQEVRGDLVLCNYDELGLGDLALRVKYRQGEYLPENQELKNYVSFQKEGYVYLDGESIIKSYDPNFLWFKVIKSKDGEEGD